MAHYFASSCISDSRRHRNMYLEIRSTKFWGSSVDAEAQVGEGKKWSDVKAHMGGSVRPRLCVYIRKIILLIQNILFIQNIVTSISNL